MKKTLTILIAIAALQVVQAQQGNNGSLAIDGINGNQYGWAINYKTQAAANNKALAECEKNGGSKCATVLWFTGGCAVYVVDPNNPGLYGWGTANTRAEAEGIARTEALARGATSLKVRVWGCNGGKLIKSNKTDNIRTKGTYMFHYSKSKAEKKFFVSNLLYVPNVAEKEGDKWSWSNSAKGVITPTAVKFYDAVEANLYSYLTKEQRKKLLKRNNNVDWVGASEIEYANKKINLNSLQERKDYFNKVKNSFVNGKKEEGYEIITINL